MNIQTSDNRLWITCGLGALTASFTLICLYSTCADVDLWGYLAFGRLYWEGGRFPYQDVFAYVPTLKPWVYHEWLTGVVFYPIFITAGEFGLQALKYGFGLGTVALAYATARLRGASPGAATFFTLLTGVILGLGYSAVRAQVFTYFFFALMLYILERVKLSKRWGGLMWLPLIMVPWANFHGGFVAGLGLIFLYALGEALSRQPFWPYVLTMVAATFATLINPYGGEYWSYLAIALTMPRPEITEWQPIWQAYHSGTVPWKIPVILLILVLFSLVVMRRKEKWEAPEILIGVVTLGLSIKSVRHMPFFALALCALLPPALKYYEDDLRTKLKTGTLFSPVHGRTFALLLLALSGVLLSIFFTWAPFSLRIPAEPEAPGKIGYYPVGAMRYLEDQQLSGKLLVYFDWGEYVLFHLYPQFRVAIDGRYETVYPLEVCLKYWDFLRARPNWKSFLKQYPPDFILLPNGNKVTDLLTQEPAWRIVYSDKGSTLFQSSYQKE